MKIFLYMATTANGYIAKEDNETPWSKEEWNNFSKKIKEVKNLIIGRKTFDIMKKGNEFQKIGNPFTIVVSKKKGNDPNFEFADSPEKALEILKEKGASEALIAGGSKLNSSFMQKKLIDEIYLDIEPLIFGKGIPIFEKNNLDIKLELIKTRKLSKNTIQLHYKVLK